MPPWCRRSDRPRRELRPKLSMNAPKVDQLPPEVCSLRLSLSHTFPSRPLRSLASTSTDKENLNTPRTPRLASHTESSLTPLNSISANLNTFGTEYSNISHGIDTQELKIALSGEPAGPNTLDDEIESQSASLGIERQGIASACLDVHLGACFLTFARNSQTRW